MNKMKEIKFLYRLLLVFVILSQRHVQAQIGENMTKLSNTSPSPKLTNATDSFNTSSSAPNTTEAEPTTAEFNNTTEHGTESENTTTSVEFGDETTERTVMMPPHVADNSQHALIPLRDTDVPCTCDLTSGECDINCCCDQQCSGGDRRAFSRCDVPRVQTNADYCFQNNFLFANNTPYTMVKTSSNMFCIYKDNYQGRFQYKDITAVTDNKAFDRLIKKYKQFPWPVQNVFSPDVNDPLKVGTPVYTRFDSGLIGFLDIPINSITGECNTANPAAYLENQNNVCVQLINDLALECTNNIWLDARTYFQGFTVARSPVVLKDSINATTDDFIEVTPELCSYIYGIAGQCTSLELTDIPQPLYNATSNTCENSVSRVQYVISHNGTEGISGVRVQLTLDTLGQNNESPTTTTTTTARRWTQNHGIAFRWHTTANNTNSSTETPIRYSGNPGYIVGAPVLAGKLINRDSIIESEHTPVVRQAVKLSRDSSDWLTVVGAIPGGNGQCFGDPESMIGTTAGRGRISVRFGENLRTGCTLKVSMRNVTDHCALIQGVALDALLGSEPPNVVGAYGNSKVERPGEWVPILRDHVPSISTKASSDGGVTATCTNIVREMRTRILFANFGSFAAPQAKIVGVHVSLGATAELRLRCVGRFCRDGSDELSQTLAVTSSVSFVDVSETAIPVYAEPPTIRIELPSDFFYPFSSSSSSAATCCFNVIAPMSTIVFLNLLYISFGVQTIFSS